MSHSAAHAQDAFSMVSHMLPDDITTVHDYGCRDGHGTLWLSGKYPHVVGYDLTLEHVRDVPTVNVQVGDLRNPPEDADIIYVGHVLECGGEIEDKSSAVRGLLKRCRYLILGVHMNEKAEFLTEFLPECLYHSKFSCSANKRDSVTLIKGELFGPDEPVGS